MGSAVSDVSVVDTCVLSQNITE